MLDYKGDERTLGYMLADNARRNWDKTFVYFKDEQITYGEVETKANQIGNALIEMGLDQGSRIAVLLPNCPDYVFLQFGIARAGMVQVPLNTEAQGPLLTHLINNSAPDVIIIDQQFLPLLKSVEHDLNNEPGLIVRSPEPPLPEISSEKKQVITPFAELFTTSTQPPRVHVHYTDLLAIFYTSGTTGVSKGVMLPHNHNWHFPALQVKLAKMTARDIVYNPFPYYHGVSQYMATVPAMLAGGSVVIAEKFSATRFWDEIRRYNATVCWSVMTIPAVLMKQLEKPDDGDNPLRVMFGMGIDPSTWESFEKRFNVRFLNSYGSTEVNLIASTTLEEKVLNYKTSGKSTPDFQVAIVDEDDNVLPPGEVGYIVSRPKIPYIQMLGYYNMPDETLKASSNLWLHNGDMGYLDKDGWLYFTGRGKDAMRIGGENVSAQEVEMVINSHPAVVESAVIAVSGELGEDEIKVDIVLKEKESLPPQDLLSFCQGKMSKHMLPRYIQFRESLPKTGTEKIAKAKLKEEGLTPDTWDRSRNDYIKNLPG